MQYRAFGRTGWEVSSVGFGAWAIGAEWGPVDDEQSMAALRTAVEEGINLFDTADVYGDGRSERLIGQLRSDYPGENLHVVTKAGRRLSPHTADGYNAANLERFIGRSLRNLQTDSLDLVQLHCPPTDVYYRPGVFEALDGLQTRGLIQHYGVSVERVEEALKAIEFPGVKSVQIIFNMFRQRPAERFLSEAENRNVAILARVPLASGLLTGKMTLRSQFQENDHRSYNRHGEAFDVGETFAGIDYATGLEAVESLRSLLPPGMSMAQFALRWIQMFPAVGTVIPGAKNPAQVRDNAASADCPPIPAETMEAVRALYNARIRPLVHQRW
ncbi:MAG TPA: aldo/keto reductase [Acidimicrobiia bacterium]|nr:aldo/keto reductase [Acidimicrobiia bacterium]